MVVLQSAIQMLGPLPGLVMLYLVYRGIKGYRAGKPSAEDHVPDSDDSPDGETSTQRRECPDCGAPVSQGQCISCLADVGRPGND